MNEGILGALATLKTCFYISIFARLVHGGTYHCVHNERIDITDASGTIETRQLGASYYDNNMHCTWVITAQHVTDNILIKVQKSELAWAPETAICNSHDYVEVLSGSENDYVSDKYDNGDYHYYNNYDEHVLVSWCGKRNPVSIITSTNKAIINFRTNDRNTGGYKYFGVTLDFEVITRPPPHGGCPTDWVMGPSPTTGPYCYGLQTHEETWPVAQDYCSYNQANLASLTSDQEANFVSEMIQRKIKPKQKAWIGLNDVSVDGHYQWMESLPLNTTPRWKDIHHKSNEFLNCVYLDYEGKWTEDSCSESNVQSRVKYWFLCKKLASGTTTVYLVPDERIEKGDEGKLPPKAAIIVGVLALCLLVIGIIAAMYWKCKPRHHQPVEETTDAMDMCATNTAPQSPSAPPLYTPPPSYTEAMAIPLKVPPPTDV